MSSARIHALWEIASVRDADKERRLTEMLTIAATSLRTEIPMAATLSYLDRAEVRYEIVVWSGDPDESPFRNVIHNGSASPFPQTIQSLIYADGEVHAWDNIKQSEIAGFPLIVKTGLLSVIGAAFSVGQQTHFLAFSSTHALADDPFTIADREYISVVARLFAGTYNQFEYIERLRSQLEHDSLTGLQNQLQFRKAIRDEIARDVPFAIAIVNLDHFRDVNESYGHMIADETLVEIAAELKAVGEDNLVTRKSGDEFGLLVRGIPASEKIENVVESYLRVFRTPFHTGDRDGTRVVSIGASFGWATYPDSGVNAEDLMRRAEVSLDLAKERGGGTSVVFTDAMERIIVQRKTARSEIEYAFADDQFRLMYQPTFELATRRIVGAEALIRWDHPHRGELAPVSFLPTIARNGLMGRLSRWVLASVVRDIGAADALPSDFRCYFNLVSENLEDFAFINQLTDAVAENPRLADHLGVEVTETTAMLNVEQCITTLALFQGLGLFVAIDDFGTGYSSLSYLKRLSADVVKIDRSFIEGLPFDPQDVALTEMMISICSRFHIAVLGEGIETEAQRMWLLDHGCTYGQGFLVAKPLSFTQLKAALKAQVALI